MSCSSILAQHSFSDLCISSPFQHLVLARAQRLPERGVIKPDAAYSSCVGARWSMADDHKHPALHALKALSSQV